MSNVAQAPKDRSQELVGQTVKSLYISDKQIRIHFENGLDIMILPRVTIRDFDGITPVIDFKFLEPIGLKSGLTPPNE